MIDFSHGPIRPTPSLFTYTSGPTTPPVKCAIVGEAWGKDEERERAPFVGQSGERLTSLLASAGISRRECFITNVWSRRPPSNSLLSPTFFLSVKEAKEQNQPTVRGLHPAYETLSYDLPRLYSQLRAVRPNLIVALGNYPLWALTSGIVTCKTIQGYRQPSGIMKWRGSLLSWNRCLDGSEPANCPLVPTIHPAAALRQYTLNNIIKHDLATRVYPHYSGCATTPPPTLYLTRPSFTETLAFLNNLPVGAEIAVDIETRYGQIACLGIATSPTRAICIPFMCVERPDGYWEVDEEAHILEKLRLILGGACTIIGQNYPYDMAYIHRWLAISPTIDHDTMVAQRLLFPGTPLSLSYQASLYCAHYRYWKDDGRNWDIDTLEEQLWTYNCNDACATYEIAQVQKGLFHSISLSKTSLFYNTNVKALFDEQMQILRLGFEMQCRGVRIDPAVRNALAFDVLERVDTLQAELSYLLADDVKATIAASVTHGKAPWYRSQRQLCALFYNVLSFPPVVSPKTGNPTCDDGALEHLKELEPALSGLFARLQELRTLGVMLTHFLRKPTDPDGRLRCSFNAIPNTFRWSSSETPFDTGANLQTIPKG